MGLGWGLGLQYILNSFKFASEWLGIVYNEALFIYKTIHPNDQVPKEYAENLKRFSDLGLDVAITELTLQIKKPIIEESRKQQTKDYVQVVDACLSVKRCVGITVWEFTDKYNWLVTRNDTNFGEACLWDVNYKPHQAVSAIEKVLR